jgi:hypothetical protein
VIREPLNLAEISELVGDVLAKSVTSQPMLARDPLDYFTPTPADREAVRAADVRRKMKAARQAKGFRP